MMDLTARCSRRRFVLGGLACLGAGLLGSIKSLFPGVGRLGQDSSCGMDFQGAGMSDNRFEPAYLKLHLSGELKRRGQELWEIMKECRLCPRECKKDRFKGIKGDCHSDYRLKISAFHPHFGEERPLVGQGGSGTIFLSNCSLKCVYCINWEISQGGAGKHRSLEEMAGMMLGCRGSVAITLTW